MALKFQAEVLTKKEIEVKKLPPVDFGNQGFDPKNWAEKVATSAKTKQSHAGPGLKLIAPVTTIGLMKDALLSPAEKLLRQAKALIKDKKFTEARVILAKAKKTDPDLLMAAVLDSFCCYRLGDDWAALECMLPVHGRPMDETTGKYYAQVMDLIRKRMLPLIVDGCMAELNAGNHQSAVNKLKRAVTLDPTVVVYHSLYANALHLMGQLEEALAAADAGLAACPPQEIKDLQELRRHILLQLAFAAMRPAATCYRNKKYAQGRKLLSGLAPAIKELSLWRTFDDYLFRLSGWLFNRKVDKVRPIGNPEDVEALYLLLVGQEIAFSQLMLMAQQFESATKALDLAQQFAPHYGYLQFLRGVSIYQHIGYQLNNGSHPPMEAVCYRLQEAREFATRALECGYRPADRFKQVLQSTLGPLEAVVAPPEEAKLINGLVEQFGAAMKLVGDGLSSDRHVTQVFRAIQAVGKRGKKMRGRMRSKAGITTLDDLDKAVERHCQQLDKVRQEIKDGKIAEKHFVAFKKMMDEKQQRPVASRAEQKAVRDFFINLKNNVEADRRTMRSEKVTSEVDQLLQFINRLLEQL